MGKSKPRGRNLSDTDIESIVEILDGWSGTLAWDLLLEAVESRMRAAYTRQAMYRHGRIRAAYQARKGVLTGAVNNLEGQLRKLGLSEAQVVLERSLRLEAENARLKTENERLLEQFVVWAYNAHTRGLTQDFLNRPLSRVDRDQTRVAATAASTKKLERR